MSRTQSREKIRFLVDPSFSDRRLQEWLADPGDAIVDEREFGATYMPDDLTRALAKKMHYAGYRAENARRVADSDRWRARYFALRDRIVLGNRKLIFGAVRKKLYQNQSADDLVGECYIVMIRTVAAYNPWLGIRFSTYAYTCLMRALSRLNQRCLADRLARHLSLDQVLGEEPVGFEVEPQPSNASRLQEFLNEGHPLLSRREKTVLRRRFHLAGANVDSTLEKVGRDLGISKERVRQVQANALDKLRHALGPCPLA